MGSDLSTLRAFSYLNTEIADPYFDGERSSVDPSTTSALMQRKPSRFRLLRKGLSIEQLEQRQLLAADMFEPLDSCIPLASSTTSSASVVASAAIDASQPESASAESSLTYPAINLAKFQPTFVDSIASGTDSTASEATDGIVSNDSRWVSKWNSDPHWVEVRLQTPYPVGSAQIYLGVDDTNNASSFDVQYHDGSSWQTIISVTGDNSTDHNLVFPATVDTATRFRVLTNTNNLQVKEFVLLPPNGPSGFPLGTGVNINLGSQLAPGVTSVAGSNFAINANDGYVADDSRWIPGTSEGTQRLALRLPNSHEVGSVHLYSGEVGPGGSTINPLSDFTIHYSNNGGSNYTQIPGGTVSSGTMTGGSVTGNTSGELVIHFSTPVLANRIRISFNQANGPVRELVALPANTTSSGSGYPIGASVKIESPPATEFTDYGDDWYRIVSRQNSRALIADESGASQVAGGTSEVARQYQLLYSYALDAYRIRAEDSGLALQVENASMDDGAAIVEGEYSAAPHQLWRLEPTDSGYFQFVNVWSGMVLQTGGAYPNEVTQKPFDEAADPANNVEWRLAFIDNYFKKGTASATVGSFGTSWSYNWSRGNFDSLSDDQFYVPMQFRQGWPALPTLHQKYSDWNDELKPAYLLGFNEPDKEEQANMTVGTAVGLWPQLTTMDVPLVSPGNAHGANGRAWLRDFSDQTDALGYRTDYAATHWYSTPNVNSVLNYVDGAQADSNGRDVWLTEFAVVDWSGGNGNWSEETNYNFILEFMYRAESKANLDKYALFLWTGAEPTTPWEKSNPRSDFFISNSGKALTPFGKAYAGWDGETTVENETLYVIHNRDAGHRLQNDGGAALEKESIRVEDDSVQWLVQDAGNGEVFLTSAVDGRRAKLESGNIVMAAAGATGWGVRWKIQQDEYGWQNIIHSGSGDFLRLNRVNNGSGAPVSQTFDVVSSASAAASQNSTDWWFVKPYVPATGISRVIDTDSVANLVTENLPAGTSLGLTASAEGIQAGDTIAYALNDDAGGRFTIDASSGVVTTGAVLDFESESSYEIEVKATSSDGSVSSETFTIDVGDVFEIPPTVETIEINGGAVQRSAVNSLRVTFDQIVVINDAGGDPFQLMNMTTNEMVSASRADGESGGKTVIDFTFAPSGQSITSFGSLINGNYELQIDATLVTSQGVQLDGDGDSDAGGHHVFGAVDGLFRKYGDVSGDNTVGLTDFASFRQTFGTTSGDIGFRSELDGNDDDTIGLSDFAIFRQGFGT